MGVAVVEGVLRDGSARLMSRTPMVLAEIERVVPFVRGRVLEIGYGLGVLHARIHTKPDVQSVHVVDVRSGVLAHKDCRCPSAAMSWEAVPPEPLYMTVICDLGAESPPLRHVARLWRTLCGPRTHMIWWNPEIKTFEILSRETLRALEGR